MNRNPLRPYFRHGFLPQLIAFEACVRLGSVTRAAEELSVAQPTVSCMLRKLSDAVGGPVTRVRDRRVVPTPLGERLLELFAALSGAFGRFDAERAPAPAPGPRYHPAADLPAENPWHLPSPPRRPSPSKRRASPCPLARPKPCATDGAS